MPTYDYRCPDGHEFERFYRKISDAASELACPTCGQPAGRVVSGGAGLLFKGSGFYLTDYGKNAHRKGGAAGKAASPESDSASAEKTTKSGSEPAKPEAVGKPGAEPGGAPKPASESGTDSKPKSAKPARPKSDT